MMACAEGAPMEHVQVMLSGCSDADIKCIDEYRFTALHHACWQDVCDIRVITILLKRDSELVHMTTLNGYTPLTIAVRTNHVDVLLMLLGLNVNVNHVDSYGLTPLDHADALNNVDVARILRRARADGWNHSCAIVNH
jgi:ankyrin repeat protein